MSEPSPTMMDPSEHLLLTDTTTSPFLLSAAFCASRQDVCYTWWVLSSLSMLGRLHWVDRTALVAFILSCQDPEEGGISDRPDDEVDVFHTFFGIAGLSLLKYPGLSEVNAKYAMPQRVIEKMGLT